MVFRGARHAGFSRAGVLISSSHNFCFCFPPFFANNGARLTTRDDLNLRMHLHKIDLVIIVAYLIAITLFGLRFRKSQRSLRDYFLADRNIPWWAISLSIVAAETSTLTIIGTPAIAYGGNFGFLQLVFGYLLGRIVICILFIPQYFRGEMFTAYQLIDRRFGKVLHRVTAAVFLVLRSAAEGVRVWAVSIVVLTAFQMSDVAAVAVIMVLTLIYT